MKQLHGKIYNTMQHFGDVPRPITHPSNDQDHAKIYVRLENGDIRKLDIARRRLSRAAFAREILMEGVEKILRERQGT